MNDPLSASEQEGVEEWTPPFHPEAGYRFAVREFDDGTDVLPVDLHRPELAAGIRF